MNQQQANLKIQQLFSAQSNGDFQQVLNIALELQKHFPKFILGYKAAGVALEDFPPEDKMPELPEGFEDDRPPMPGDEDVPF